MEHIISHRCSASKNVCPTFYASQVVPGALVLVVVWGGALGARARNWFWPNPALDGGCTALPTSTKSTPPQQCMASVDAMAPVECNVVEEALSGHQC